MNDLRALTVLASISIPLFACSAPPSGAARLVGSSSDAGSTDGGSGISRGSGDAGAGADGTPPYPAGPDGAASDATDEGGALAPTSPIYGVTVDDVSSLADIVGALGALPHKPTTRVVFDQGQSPGAYAQAVAAIGTVSYVMGELLDSQYVSAVPVSAYAQRASDYLAAFPRGVDLWEVGNEINGNWLGSTADVVAKMTVAFDLVVAAHNRTALTLYGCSDSGPSYDMLTWAAANVPPRMRTGLDYVLVSYYEGDCGVPRAASDWPSIFQQLHQMFPNAGVGFGEVGSVDSAGNDVSDPAVAGPYLQKYYGMQIAVPNYVGGYFWWYLREDMIPMTQPLFAVLSSAMR